MNVLVFDIETIPDTTGGTRLHGFEGLSDSEIAEAMFTLRRQDVGHDFLKHHLHRVVAISVALKQQDQFKVWSLGEEDDSEAELIRRFFQGIDKYIPTLVSWNGSGFDLPVLHYRALINEIAAPRYFENGEYDQGFRWNNYLNRYHERHLDLMDSLAGFQARAVAPLDEIATLLGFPGKFNLSGGEVWTQYQAGNLKLIRDYCETDVLNTYLVYLRFEFMRGHLSEQQLRDENQCVRDFLQHSDAAHLNEFLTLWQDNS